MAVTTPSNIPGGTAIAPPAVPTTTKPVTSTSYLDSSTPSVTATSSPTVQIASVPTTKPAPAVVTADPAKQILANAQNVLAEQTASLQTQAQKNAQAKLAADQKTQQQAQTDQSNKLLNAITYPVNPNTGLPIYGSSASGVPGVIQDANGNYQTKDQNGNIVTIDASGRIVGGGTTTSSSTSNNTNTNQGTYSDQLAQLNDQSDQAYNDYITKINQLQNGTFALTPTQQAEVDALQKRFDVLKEQQTLANKNYTAGVTQVGITQGLQRYSPMLQLGKVQTAINAGIQKIGEIDAKAAAAINEMKNGFMDDNFKLVNAAYTAFKDLQKEKSTQIQHLSDQAQSHSEWLADYNIKAENQATERAKNVVADVYENVLMNPNQRDAIIQEYADKFGVDPVVISSQLNKYATEQQAEAFKRTMESDKWTWQQKQDLIANQLAERKFTYQQQQDARQYALDLRRAQQADTPSSYKEWLLAGQPGTYSSWLMNSAGKPATVDEQKNAGFAMRMQEANSTINVLTDQWKKLGFIGQTFAANAPNVLKSPETQQMEQAERDFVNAVLRRESGATISPQEFDNARKQYFPQPGDSEQVLRQKESNRLIALKGISQSSGPALTPEFKKNVGKTTYSSVQQFRDLNPESWSYVQQQIKDNGITNEIDAIKYINKLDL